VAHRIGTGQSTRLADQRGKSVEHTVAHLVGQDRMFGIGDGAVGFEEDNVALRRDLVGVLVVDHFIGEQDAAVVVDLDMSACRRDFAVGVVLDLVRAQQHLLVGFGFGLSAMGRRCRCTR